MTLWISLSEHLKQFSANYEHNMLDLLQAELLSIFLYGEVDRLIEEPVLGQNTDVFL